MSYETRYATAMRQRADAAASTPEAAAARLKHRDAMQRGRSDALAKFGAITLENAGEMLEYQNERITHWLKELCFSPESTQDS